MNHAILSCLCRQISETMFLFATFFGLFRMFLSWLKVLAFSRACSFLILSPCFVSASLQSPVDLPAGCAIAAAVRGRDHSAGAVFGGVHQHGAAALGQHTQVRATRA